MTWFSAPADAGTRLHEVGYLADEATATTAVCSHSLCECRGAAVVTKVGAPCTVTSLAGRCEVSHGECCLCRSK